MKSLRQLEQTDISRSRSVSRSTSSPAKLKQLIPPTLAVLVYCNSLAGDFVHDDLSAVTTNPDVTGRLDPTAGSNWDFLRNDFWGTSLTDPTSHKSYRPLTILTFRWNYALSGLRPWSYHAVNVILHALVCWLLSWTCHRCFRLSLTTSLLAASFFALHPIHTEAVSGVVGRADILATLFFLLSFISHDRATADEDSSKRASTSPSMILLRIASLVSALLALLAKETGIAALPVAMAWDIIRMSSSSTTKSNRIKTGWKWWIRSCRMILFSLFTTLVFLVGRISLQQGQLPLFSEQDNPAAFASDRKSRILTLLYLPVFNMQLLLAPVVLSYDWQNGSIPLVNDWSDCRNLLTILFYASMILVVSYAWMNRNRVVLWSWAVMVLPMLPASNLFYPCGFVVAERLLYLPSTGYCLLVAFGLRRMAKTLKRPCRVWRMLVVVAAALCAVLAVKTWCRNGDWKDRRTLFESGLRSLPHNAKMHYNYANVQKDDGRWDEAIQHYRTAIRLWPEYASALNNLGTVLLAKAEEEMDVVDDRKSVFRLESELVREAENRFRQAIRSHPHHIHAHYNLAVLYSHRNETEAAVQLLRRCLHIQPMHHEALQLLRRMEGGSTLFPAAHLPSPPPPPPGWINTADRLPSPEQLRQHRPAGGPDDNNNSRWNKTA